MHMGLTKTLNVDTGRVETDKEAETRSFRLFLGIDVGVVTTNPSE